MSKPIYWYDGNGNLVRIEYPSVGWYLSANSNVGPYSNAVM